MMYILQSDDRMVSIGPFWTKQHAEEFRDATLYPEAWSIAHVISIEDAETMYGRTRVVEAMQRLMAKGRVDI
jgi:hypothetical protein